MMQSVALESNVIMNEDNDYIFIQPEDMDIDDEASYDDCDEAITFPSSSSQGWNVAPLRSTSKELTAQNIVQSEFFSEMESAASVVSLENSVLEGKNSNGTLSLEGSTTFFTDETLPSLDEVNVQMEIADSSPIANFNEASLQGTTNMIVPENNEEVLKQDNEPILDEKTKDTNEDSSSIIPVVKTGHAMKEDLQKVTIKSVNESSETKKVCKPQTSKSRLSNKKRRKQMKKQKKANAAEAAANALAEMRSINNSQVPENKSKKSSSASKTTTKLSHAVKSRKGDTVNIAVACATQSLIDYRQQHNLKKKPDTINYVAFL